MTIFFTLQDSKNSLNIPDLKLIFNGSHVNLKKKSILVYYDHDSICRWLSLFCHHTVMTLTSHVKKKSLIVTNNIPNGLHMILQWPRDRGDLELSLYKFGD